MSGALNISPAKPEDWPSIWRMLEPVFRAGETYAVDRDINEVQARNLWTAPPACGYLATDAERGPIGTYSLKANFAGPASGVGNCGYVVDEPGRGRGVARLMCRHSQGEARRAGFHTLQFNCVVSSNRSAIGLWQSEGFAVSGRLPRVFDHPRLGRVDALVMTKALDAEDARG